MEHQRRIPGTRAWPRTNREQSANTCGHTNDPTNDSGTAGPIAIHEPNERLMIEKSC